MDLMAHMAILTANLGKKLSVDQSCLLRHMLMRIPPKSSPKKRSVVEFSARTEEDCNAEIFSILDWHAVHAYVRQADGYGRSKVLPHVEHSELDESELDELAHLCKCDHEEGAASAAAAACTAAGVKKKEDRPRTWNNTITVTAKGAVILRFSWSRPMPWTKRHARITLAASNLACRLIECCS
jgi:hypothetical protein